jgi:hypothetical protein
MSRAVVAPATIGVPTPLVAVDWRRRARCATHDADLWFSLRDDDRALAFQICLACPVRAQCETESRALFAARPAPERFGRWGLIDHDGPRLRRLRAERRAAYHRSRQETP